MINNNTPKTRYHVEMMIGINLVSARVARFENWNIFLENNLGTN